MPNSHLGRPFSEKNRVELVPSPNAMPEGVFFRVYLRRELKLRLGLRDWATLVFYHPNVNRVVDASEDYLAIHCRVRTFSEVPTNVAEREKEAGGANVICIDQTLRNALGLPFGVFPKLRELEVYVIPAERRWYLKISNALAQMFGIRYLIARPKKPDVPDIEKGFA